MTPTQSAGRRKHDMTGHDKMSYGARVALVASCIGVILTLLTVGAQVGSLATTVEVQADELTRIREAVEAATERFQELELYVRELQIQWARQTTPLPKGD